MRQSPKLRDELEDKVRKFYSKENTTKEENE